MSRDEVIQNLKNRHTDEDVRYTTCYQNGCWDAVCILKCRVKDGEITAIEPDDSINKDLGREDVGDEAIKQGMVQARPCVMGHSWKRSLDDPDRILYPMKRKGPRGTTKEFERISWEEAIDTISEKILEVIELYGPHSILHMDSFWDRCFFPFAPYLKAGIGAWGENSAPAQATAEFRHFGYDIGDMFSGKEYIGEVGYEAPDLFNSNLIVLWGMDPLVSWYGPVSYYMKLAREKGIPVILIDPRYTTSAEVLVDQWIPIRPGTDLAMMLAVAQVLFEEDLYDHDYADEYVDYDSLVTFHNYVMGGEDQQPKTPEWAEPICAIPAETIREFARLYAKSKPVHLQYQYGPSKRPLGEYPASAALILQAMTGNLTIAGGCETGICLWTPERMPIPDPDFKKAPPEYTAPICVNHNKVDDAILLHEQMEEGKITEEYYRQAIGCPPESPSPNVQMLIALNNFMNGLSDTNKRIKAVEKTHFNWGWLWNHNQQTMDAYDIVLPAPVHMFESTDEFLLGQTRFMQGPGGMHNYFMYAQKVVDPPGEVRPVDWVWTQIANKLGIGEKFNPLLKDVPLEEWDDAVDNIYREGYEKWATEKEKPLKNLGIDVKSWEEFQKMPVVRIPIDVPFHAFKDLLDVGANPFSHTISGKIEFSSKYFERVDSRDTRFGGKMDSIPRWEPTYMNEPASDSFYHPKTREYPLSMITAISMFRQQSCNDKNPLLQDCYEHAVWMNPCDAKARGVENDDYVRVFNEKGETIIPVYVTSKMMPGTVAIYHGRWYKPSPIKTELMPYGLDTAGSANVLIDDVHLPHAVGVNFKHGLVEIQKLGSFGGDL